MTKFFCRCMLQKNLLIAVFKASRDTIGKQKKNSENTNCAFTQRRNVHYETILFVLHFVVIEKHVHHISWMKLKELPQKFGNSVLLWRILCRRSMRANLLAIGLS